MTDDDIDLLARLCYRTWAENKNVPPWEDLPDFRKHTWRRVARRAWAVMERMERAARRTEAKPFCRWSNQPNPRSFAGRRGDG